MIVVQLINLAFIGQLNKPVLIAAVGVGNLAINMIGYGFMVGLNGALEAAVSQSYGASRVDLACVFLNRGRLAIALTFIPMVIVFSQIKTLLLMLG